MEKPGGEWRFIPAWEDKYEISSDGRVWSNISNKLLKPALRPNGYLYVCFYKARKPVWRTIHSLVAEAFYGPCPPGQQIRHYPDRNKLNNHKDNLRYGTSSEDKFDQIEHGTHPMASRIYCQNCGSKLEMRPDGSQRYCRSCSNASRRQWYQRNKEHVMQHQREKRAEKKRQGR
jgi:NUMOD4 motif/HNH endonuclease